MKRYIRSSENSKFNFSITFRGDTRKLSGTVEDIDRWDRYAYSVGGQLYLTVPSENIKKELQRMGVGAYITVDSSVSDEQPGKIIKNISEGRYDGYYRITYSDGSEMLCEGYNLLPDDAKEWLNSHKHRVYDAFYGPLGDD